MRHTFKTATILISLICLPSLSLAQQQGTWLRSLGFHYLQVPNFNTNHTTTESPSIANAWLSESTIFRVKTTTPSNSLLVGYRFNVGYYFMNNWAAGMEYGKNEQTVIGIYDARKILYLLNGSEEERVINYNINYDFTTYTGFIRRSLPLGLYLQGGLAYQDWKEERTDFGYYKITWPNIGYQLVVGGAWRFQNLSIGAGLELVMPGKPKLTVYNYTSFESTRGEGHLCNDNLVDCYTLHQLERKDIEKALSKKQQMYGLRFDFSYSIQ